MYKFSEIYNSYRALIRIKIKLIINLNIFIN